MKENALKIYLDEISQLKQAILGHVELVAIEPLQIFCPYIFIKNSIFIIICVPDTKLRNYKFY